MITRSPRGVIFIRLAAFLVGAWISGEHTADRWVVGPVFGVVVLLWHARQWEQCWRKPSLIFLACSTLIYALVVTIALSGPGWFSDNMRIYLAVAVGTFLLPLVHAVCLGADTSRLRRAVPLIYVVWFMATKLLEWLDPSLPYPWNRLINSAAIWQAIYLYALFGFTPPKPVDG